MVGFLAYLGITDISLLIMVFQSSVEWMVKRGAKNIGRLESSFRMENYAMMTTTTETVKAEA